MILKEDMHNERFEKYYKAQGILPQEEWTPFMEAMRTPLPTTFRVTGSRQWVTRLRCNLCAEEVSGQRGS